jgi:hypothetical protein
MSTGLTCKITPTKNHPFWTNVGFPRNRSIIKAAAKRVVSTATFRNDMYIRLQDGYSITNTTPVEMSMFNVGG